MSEIFKILKGSVMSKEDAAKAQELMCPECNDDLKEEGSFAICKRCNIMYVLK